MKIVTLREKITITGRATGNVLFNVKEVTYRGEVGVIQLDDGAVVRVAGGMILAVYTPPERPVAGKLQCRYP